MKLHSWLLFLVFLLIQGGNVALCSNERGGERAPAKSCGMSCCKFIELDSCECAPADETVPSRVPPMQAPAAPERVPQPSMTAVAVLDMAPQSEDVQHLAFFSSQAAPLSAAESRGLPVLLCSFLI